MSAKDQALRTAEMAGRLANAQLLIKRQAAFIDELMTIIHSADASPDIHCGFYVAKEYRFNRGQIARLKEQYTALAQGPDRP